MPSSTESLSAWGNISYQRGSSNFKETRGQFGLQLSFSHELTMKKASAPHGAKAFEFGGKQLESNQPESG
ncbi:hypothetical protein [Comamonas kerstersii]|jgi:hypothetical protein|uniref:hypothetical protein n=1 Tax=Comamonas kerstersii TaxID=225992 RepID=UPI00106379F9|nr:hypothetical protein [Comamonas kerstersii]